jgi:HNH endonuclease
MSGIGYNSGAEYSGANTNTMPPDPARLYSESGSVAFRSTDGMSRATDPAKRRVFAAVAACQRCGAPFRACRADARKYCGVPCYSAVRAEGRGGQFWPKVDKSGECWTWTGYVNQSGYGRFYLSTEKRATMAHRFAYEQIVGPIPEGLTLDHLCRNRGCVNPAHLEPVTNRENVLRGVGLPAVNAAKTACFRGHPFTPENTRIMGGKRTAGWRQCRACRLIWQRDYRRATAG